MASLDEIVGAIVSQIGKGRCQADISTLEVAQIYKDHPLLSGFPVPKMTLDEVVIDLKMAIAATHAPKVLTLKAKEEILSQLKTMVNDLAVEPNLSQFPRFSNVWRSSTDQLMQSLSNLLPVEIEVEPTSIARGMASVIRVQLTSSVMRNIDGSIGSEPVRFVSPSLTSSVMRSTDVRVGKVSGKAPIVPVPIESIERVIPQIETKLASQIQEAISKVIDKIQPVDKNRLEVLVTASDLQPIHIDKINSVKLTLREADQTWTQIETETGEVKNKLIPF